MFDWSSVLYIKSGDQIKYMEEMSSVMVGRDKEVKLLMDYLHSNIEQLTEGKTKKTFSRKLFKIGNVNYVDRQNFLSMCGVT